MENLNHNPGQSFRSMIEAAEKRCIASSFVAYPAVLIQVRFTIANQMTPEETSIWIWTLGYNFGWLDAESYAKSFWDQQIWGNMLPELSLRELEEDLGINNRNHSKAIMREIDLCFPGVKENHLGTEEQRQGSVVFMDESMAPSISIHTGSDSVYDMQESVLSAEVSLSDSSTVPITRCLVLTLFPWQKFALGPKQHVKNLFSKFNYNIEVVRSREKDNSYILVFDNEEKALKANAQFKTSRYQLSKYYPRRPSRDYHVSFKVLSPITVRVGKSLTSSRIGVLEKNDIIRVNQVKGRRARIISSQNGRQGGWVSLHGEKGERLLERCQDTHIQI